MLCCVRSDIVSELLLVFAFGPQLTILLPHPPLVCDHQGFLVSVDPYMNLQLASTEEWIDNKLAGNLGEVLIRYVTYWWRQENTRRASQRCREYNKA